MLPRLLILLTIILSACVQALAQPDTTRVKFDRYSYDFGAVGEGAEAECIYPFTNTGTDTIQLLPESVRSSCGCVTVEYTRTPVAPGEKGFIKARMYTRGRVGTFLKAIYYHQQGGPTLALYLMGVIQAAAKDSVYSKAQLKASSNLQLENTVHSFGKVKRKQEMTVSFVLKNTGKDTLKLKFDAGCHCMQYTLRKKDGTIVPYILPGEKIVLNINYTPGGFSYGSVTNYGIIQTNSLSTPSVTITINAEIIPD